MKGIGRFSRRFCSGFQPQSAFLQSRDSARVRDLDNVEVIRTQPRAEARDYKDENSERQHFPSLTAIMLGMRVQSWLFLLIGFAIGFGGLYTWEKQRAPSVVKALPL